MKRAVNLLVVLGLLAVLAAGAVWWLLRDKDPEGGDAAGPGPTKSPVLTMGTKGVEKSITDRLTARTGRDVVAECPDRVEQTVGTKFRCEVYFADDEDVTTIAVVKMTGGGGQFSWTTEAAETAEEK